MTPAKNALATGKTTPVFPRFSALRKAASRVSVGLSLLASLQLPSISLGAETIPAPTGPAAAIDPRPEKAAGVRTDVAGALSFAEPHIRLPDVHQGATLERRFEFLNTGAIAVSIEQGLALTPGGTITFEPAVVPPGGAGAVTLRQAVGNHLGTAAYRFALITGEPGVSRYRLSLSSFVESAYDPEAPLLDFGNVDTNAQAHQVLELFSREVDTLQALAVLDAPTFLQVDSTARTGLVSEGVRLRVTLDTTGLPLGRTNGALRLRTNVQNQPELEIPYSFLVRGDLVLSAEAISFGVIRAGTEAVGELTVRARSGRTLESMSIGDAAGAVATEVLSCPAAPDDPACRLVRVRYDATAPGGLQGALILRAAPTEEALTIPYSAMIVRANTEIKQLALDAAGAPAADWPAAPPSPPAWLAPAEEPRSSAASASPARVASAPEVRLDWRARRETGVYGYNIYRAETASGPFRRVNPAIVRAAAGEDDASHSYSYVDLDVRPGATYYYYLDLVDSGGKKQRFSAVRSRQVAPTPQPQ